VQVAEKAGIVADAASELTDDELEAAVGGCDTRVGPVDLGCIPVHV
jgi:hypothetical protein